MAADVLGEMDLLRGTAKANLFCYQVGFEAVAGSATDQSITGWTAAKFRTNEADIRRGSLYITTNGGLVNYFFSNWTAEGILLRLNTVRLGFY